MMSGTGNTYRVCRWTQQILQQNGVETRLVVLENADVRNDIRRASGQLVGLFFPTHGFMPPWSMIKFILRMPRRGKVPVVCVATRGAWKLGPIKIPGAAGMATFFAALVMLIKGYRIPAVFSLDMPANFINLHWGLSPKNINSISQQASSRLKGTMARLLAGKRILFTPNNLWEALWSGLILWLVPIFPILYLIIGRLFMAKVMFSSNKCVGCGRCARYCANEAIVMKSIRGKPRPYWSYHCENCMRCMGYCSKGAVEAGHSWAILLYFITSVPVMTYVMRYLHRSVDLMPIMGSYWGEALLSMFYVVPALVLTYAVFWYLLSFPIFNNLFAYTTLTHYFRRYHQPETRLKDMAPNRRKSSSVQIKPE